MIAFTSLLLAFAIVPVSPTRAVSDLNIGILFFLMMAGGGVRRAVRRLVEQQQILAVGRDARLRANPELRSVHRSVADGRGDAGGFVQHAGHR